MTKLHFIDIFYQLNTWLYSLFHFLIEYSSIIWDLFTSTHFSVLQTHILLKSLSLITKNTTNSLFLSNSIKSFFFYILIFTSPIPQIMLLVSENPSILTYISSSLSSLSTIWVSHLSPILPFNYLPPLHHLPPPLFQFSSPFHQHSYSSLPQFPFLYTYPSHLNLVSPILSTIKATILYYLLYTHFSFYPLVTLLILFMYNHDN